MNTTHHLIPPDYPVPRGTEEKLIAFENILRKWQSKINLVSHNHDDIWHRHILDSLQLTQYIQPQASIVDIGSGGGFPGLILAIAGYNNIHLVESDKRKCLFLKEAARITDTKINIHAERVEKFSLDSVDIITSRACASLIDLLSLTHHLLSENTRCIFLKGKQAMDEVEEAHMKWRFQLNQKPSATHPDGVILILNEIEKL